MKKEWRRQLELLGINVEEYIRTRQPCDRNKKPGMLRAFTEKAPTMEDIEKQYNKKVLPNGSVIWTPIKQ